MLKPSVALMIGAALIVVGGAAYFLAQEPFTDCPAFMGLLVGQLPSDVLERCHASSTIQIMGSVFFIIGVFLVIYGAVTRYSS